MAYDVETKKRAAAQREEVIQALKNAGVSGITNVQLQKISLNYTSRTAELHKQGYKIRCSPMGGGLYNYVLLHEPETKQRQKKAVDMFFDMLDKQYDGKITSDELREMFDKHCLNVVRNWGANTK